MTMTDAQVRAMWDAAKSRVMVSCCEYHNHSATSGCLDGPEDAVNVCKMAEAILSLRARIRSLGVDE